MLSLNWHKLAPWDTVVTMLSYVRPVVGLKYLFYIWRRRNVLAKENIARLAELFNGKVYISTHERYVLYQILCDLGWSGKTILVPDYTCPSITEAIHQSGNKTLRYPIRSPFEIDEDQFRGRLGERPAAVLASHVYGHPMPVRDIVLEHFSGSEDRPLLISDLAHAQTITPNDKRAEGYDVVLYSTAYYKPMSLPNLGVGMLRAPLGSRAVDVPLDGSSARALLQLVAFYLLETMLRTRLLRISYRLRPPRDGISPWLVPSNRILSSNVAFLDGVIEKSPPDFRWQFSYYDKLLEQFPQIHPVAVDQNLTSYYPVTVESGQRDQLHKFFLEQNIYLGRIFFHIVADSDAINRYSDWLASRVLNLPVGPHVTEEHMALVGQVLKKYFANAGKRNEAE